MDLGCILRHGVRTNAPNEVMGHPHLEIIASDERERWKLKALADQLRAFGSIPFAYQEMESTGGSLHSSVLRIALCERCDAGQPTGAPAGAPADRA